MVTKKNWKIIFPFNFHLRFDLFFGFSKRGECRYYFLVFHFISLTEATKSIANANFIQLTNFSINLNTIFTISGICKHSTFTATSQIAHCRNRTFFFRLFLIPLKCNSCSNICRLLWFCDSDFWLPWNQVILNDSSTIANMDRENQRGSFVTNDANSKWW